MTTIKLNRGETLGILATPKQSGAVIVLDETWTVAAAIAPQGSTAGETDLGAIISAGKVSISFDTVNLAVGPWQADIRITNADGTDQWTEKMKVIIAEPVTKPSTRA